MEAAGAGSSQPGIARQLGRSPASGTFKRDTTSRSGLVQSRIALLVSGGLNWPVSPMKLHAPQTGKKDSIVDEIALCTPLNLRSPLGHQAETWPEGRLPADFVAKLLLECRKKLLEPLVRGARVNGVKVVPARLTATARSPPARMSKIVMTHTPPYGHIAGNNCFFSLYRPSAIARRKPHQKWPRRKRTYCS
jgi:hypothetical protein